MPDVTLKNASGQSQTYLGKNLIRIPSGNDYARFTPEPSGTLQITQNGTYDVSAKASAVVNINTKPNWMATSDAYDWTEVYFPVAMDSSYTEMGGVMAVYLSLCSELAETVLTVGECESSAGVPVSTGAKLLFYDLRSEATGWGALVFEWEENGVTEKWQIYSNQSGTSSAIGMTLNQGWGAYSYLVPIDGITNYGISTGRLVPNLSLLSGGESWFDRQWAGTELSFGNYVKGPSI